MAEINPNEAPKAVRDLYLKATGALEKGNLDYAMELLTRCVEMTPELTQARRLLRQVQVKRLGKKAGSPMTQQLAMLTGMPGYLKAMASIKSGKYKEALVTIEQLLAKDPLQNNFIKAFVDAAIGAGVPESAIVTLEIAKDYDSENIHVLQMLGMLYTKMGRNSSARQCFEKLCEIAPNDPKLIKALKDVTAMESIKEDGWGKATSYRDIMKDQKEAELLEQQSKAVKSDKDADALIKDTLNKIEQEPGNINYFRQLARLYCQVHRFEEAVDALNKAQKMAPGDPELDQALTNARLQWFEYDIEKMQAAGDEAGMQAKQMEMAQYKFEDLQERVKRYPNDLKLKYELGRMLFDNDYIDEAIQQFQLSQRSPKHREESLYYLGLCLKSKAQYDLAIEQLDSAQSEIYEMDDTKKLILYEMGVISELMGNLDQAAKYYKQIYQVDIGFKDISDKVASIYEARKSTG